MEVHLTCFVNKTNTNGGSFISKQSFCYDQALLPYWTYFNNSFTTIGIFHHLWLQWLTEPEPNHNFNEPPLLLTKQCYYSTTKTTNGPKVIFGTYHLYQDQDTNHLFWDLLLGT